MLPPQLFDKDQSHDAWSFQITTNYQQKLHPPGIDTLNYQAAASNLSLDLLKLHEAIPTTQHQVFLT